MNKKKCRFLVYAVALAAGMSAVPGTAGADPVESDSAVVSDAVIDDLAGQPASEVPASTSGTAVEAGAAKKEERPDDQSIRESIRKFEGLTLAEINFVGGSEQTRATAQAATSLRAGDAFTSDALDKDAESIMNTGYFVDLYPSFEQVPEGIVLTYHLQEYPVYRGVEFSGNTVVSTEELKKMVTLREGESFNGITFHKNMQAVEDKYHEEGYIQARIVDMHQTADGIIQVKVNEGVLEGFKVKGNEKTKEYVILRE
ncbi:MAG: outer membrane protein assembly factor, partial [Selenomonadaceae bacterium]|nr:outer membrane protein assembly factor [Selenomonadaceae bacterium]